MASAFVQAAGNSNGTSGTTVVLTLGAAASVGNLLVLQVYIASTRTFTITDDGSGTALTWTSIRRMALGAGADPILETFYAYNTGRTGATNFTVTISGTATSSTRYATMAEYSGITDTSPLVGHGFYTSAGASEATGTTSSFTPSGAPIRLVSFAVGDLVIGSRPLNTSSPTDYLTNNRVSQMTNQMRIGDLREETATTEQVTWSWSGGNQRFGLVLAAFEEAVVGPTITVQPANDVGIISNGQSTVYTTTATGTTISNLVWREDGSTIGHGGIYNIVTTGIGTGSVTSTLTITRTSKVNTPWDIRASVTDANGTTETNTVTDTWWTGPVLTTFPATDGSGESTATLTSDYVTGVGEAIEVRIPLADGDVAVTVTTT